MSAPLTLVLGRRDVARLLSLDECIAAVESAFRLLGEGAVPPPSVLAVQAREGSFHLKAGLLPLARNLFAAKVNANYPENPARFQLPTIQGVIVLADAENGRPLAILDSIEITALRTAAATAVAARFLARPDSRIATICGCGAQGRVQLRALCRVLPLQTAYAWDTAPGRAAAFARDLSAELGIAVLPAGDLSEATRQSDVCVTATTAHRWFLGRAHVRSGAFVAAVGADNPEKQELEPELVAASALVCDLTEQCAAIGELHHALAAGVMRNDAVHADLGAVVAGKARGRTSAEEIVVFDSTGLALQDAAAAAVVYEKALATGAGLEVDFAA